MDMTVDDPAGRPRSSGQAARLPTGTVLNDRYQIDEFVAHTPYGQMFRARDLADNRQVTIKALAPQLLGDARVRQRLEREIQLAVQLDHKNVGATYGLFGAMVGSDAVSYLATEFVDGQTLREMIDKKRATGRTFSLKGTYNVVAHLCNALIYAHGATVHGGLTPLSILVNTAGRVKVVDFGLARTLKPLDHFQAQVGSGGMAALAPEMIAQPEKADARADLYSVGVILFELLTGQPISDSFTPPSQQVPGVPKAVDDVVERCLRPIPDERYGSAQELKAALHASLAAELEGEGASQPGVARPSSPAIPVRPAQPTPTPAPAAPARTSKPPAPPPMGSSPPAPQPPQPGPRPAAPSPQRPQPAAAGGSGVQRAAVPKSFNVDSALSAVDDQTERWLIQKDKLDFGPFNMREVRSQIESGKILGEHTIIDTENGERRKVKDHPQLRQLVMETEARSADKQREEAEAADRRKARGKIVTMVSLFLVAVLGVGGFVMWKWKPWEKRVEQVVVHDKEDLDFLKNVEITMKVDPPAKKTHTGGHHKNKNGTFDDSTNLGDASEGGGDETLDQSVVQQVMSKNFRVLVGCITEERRRNPSLHNVDMDFIIKGTGNVSAVKVNGQTGTALAGCMYGKMQSVAFPKFNGAKTHASFSLALK
jgi:serine/threonine-protein kinase